MIYNRKRHSSPLLYKQKCSSLHYTVVEEVNKWYGDIPSDDNCNYIEQQQDRYRSQKNSGIFQKRYAWKKDTYNN